MRAAVRLSRNSLSESGQRSGLETNSTNKDGDKVWDPQGIFEGQTQLESYSLFLAAKMSNKDHNYDPFGLRLALFCKWKTQNDSMEKIKVFFFTSMWFRPKANRGAPKHPYHFQHTINS